MDEIALKIVADEVKKYSDQEFNVTEKVSFNMRNLIQKCRKNYWGIFDKPKDKNTGADKQWVPLTRVLCDGAYKNSDVDSKDVSFRARNRTGRAWTTLIRGFVRELLDRQYYGEVIDQDRLRMIIDGTVVWKTYKERLGGKTYVRRQTVELLNCFIDPTARSIQDAFRFTERSLMTVDDIKRMKGWKNTDEVKSAEKIKTERGVDMVVNYGEMVDVYEMWGKIEKSVITGNKEDTDLIDGHIVVSGVDNGEGIVHLVEENKNKDRDGNIIKPYEEGWYLKVPNRWYGMGIPESVLYMQEWINMVINMRIQKNRLAQLGILKWRSDKDIPQQMISNLVANGVMKVTDQDDLTSLDVAPAGQDSYADEDNIRRWSQEVTSIFDQNLGAPMPASTSATGAVIQQQAGKSAFVLVKESWGFFQQRWIDRHVMPHVGELMKQESFATVFGDFEEIQTVRKGVASYLAMQEMEKAYKKDGTLYTKEEVDAMIAETEMRLRKEGDLFFDIIDEVITDGIYTKVYFTNEEIDISVTARNLIDMMNMTQDVGVRNDFMATVLDILGIPVPQSLLESAPMQQPQQGELATADTPTLQSQVTDLNTMPSTTAPTAI